MGKALQLAQSELKLSRFGAMLEGLRALVQAGPLSVVGASLSLRMFRGIDLHDYKVHAAEWKWKKGIPSMSKYHEDVRWLYAVFFRTGTFPSL